MRMRRVGLAASVILVLIGCSQADSTLTNAYSRMDIPPGEPSCLSSEDPRNCNTSLVALVANPERLPAGSCRWSAS
jgi:hypothetical protein